MSIMRLVILRSLALRVSIIRPMANEPYYGLGAGAGMVMRWDSVMSTSRVFSRFIDATLNRLPRLETNAVPEEEAMEDFMMVGLRMLDGVSTASFTEQFDGHTIEEVFGPQLNQMLENGLMECVERASEVTGYRLSEKGIPLGNEVFGAFISS